jgi:hypothetical protein
VVGSRWQSRSVVGTWQWQAGEEVDGTGSGFVERRWARAEVAVVTEEHVGGRRWHLMRRSPRQMKEAADSVLQWFLLVDDGSAAGLAWLRGARERCAVVTALVLGAEEHHERQSGGASAQRLLQKEERTSFSFRPTARGEDAQGGGCMRCAWSRRGGWSTTPA